MKYVIITALAVICISDITFAQTGLTSREIISRSSSGSSSTSSSYSEIRARTSRDAKMNKINNDLNYYRNLDDSSYSQKVMELEKEKSKMINIK